MVQQIQSVCMECHGERISPKDRCKSCDGRKIVREKNLEVHIDKGMKDGQKTTFHGQIVKHGDIKHLLNKGMPIYRRPYEKGCFLIIEFKEFSRSPAAQGCEVPDHDLRAHLAVGDPRALRGRDLPGVTYRGAPTGPEPGQPGPPGDSPVPGPTSVAASATSAYATGRPPRGLRRRALPPASSRSSLGAETPGVASFPRRASASAPRTAAGPALPRAAAESRGPRLPAAAAPAFPAARRGGRGGRGEHFGCGSSGDGSHPCAFLLFLPLLLLLFLLLFLLPEQSRRRHAAARAPPRSPPPPPARCIVGRLAPRPRSARRPPPAALGAGGTRRGSPGACVWLRPSRGAAGRAGREGVRASRPGRAGRGQGGGRAGAGPQRARRRLAGPRGRLRSPLSPAVPSPPALVDPAPQTGRRRRCPHPGKQEEPAVFGGSTRCEDDTCFRGMHSEPGKSRGSQTQRLDGFSQVTFMLHLKGAALANVLFLKPPVQFLDKAVNWLSSLLEMLFSQIFI
ncbi:uncharacterized protein [Vulpes vulpes]|uniref:Uncharacterized protein n=1 Tax=Vulpes vulpes TaxID=9627 RepID=A0ABM4ZPZ5_VULVU